MSIFLWSNQSISQDSLTRLFNNQCTFVSDGKGKYMDLKIKITYPCGWELDEAEDIIKSFSYTFDDGSLIFQSLFLEKLPSKLSKEELGIFFSQNQLKKTIKDLGTFISARKIKVNGRDCGEVVGRMYPDSATPNINIYFIHYYFIIDDKLILISYSTNGVTEKRSKLLFNKHKILFQSLAQKTVIESKKE
jgi:hypothetical protein